MPDDFIADDFQADDFVPDAPAKPKSRSLAAPPPSSGNMLLDAVRGAGAGAIGTIVGAYNLARKLPGADSLLPPPNDYVEGLTKPPETMAGSVGHFAESIGEFALPMSKVGKATKAVEAATKVGKGAGTIRTALSAAAPVATRAIGEGLGAGAIEAVRSGGDLDKAKTTAAFGAAGGAAVPVVGGLAEKALSGWAGKALTDMLGKTTGAGGEAVRTAFTSASQRFKDAMRNHVSELEIVQDLKGAVKDVMSARADKYRQQLAALPTNIQLNKKGVMQTVLDELPKFSAQITGTNSKGLSQLASTGRLGASVNKNDLTLMQEALNTIQHWGDKTPAGMDQLKQRVYDLADAADPRVQPFFYRIGDRIKQELNSNVLGYEKMTGDYAKASEFLKQVQKELSSNSENPGTIIRKLSYALNQNNTYRQVLLEALDSQTGAGLKDAIAGHALSGTMPRGLAGVMAGGAAAYMHNPNFLFGLMLSSPRAVGETMALLSNLRRAGGPPDYLRAPAQALIPATGSAVNQKAPGLPPPPSRN